MPFQQSEALNLESSFHKILGEPSRLRIVLRLLEGEANVGELAEVASLSHSRVSQLLVRMRELGFVVSRRAGNFIPYQLHPTWADAAAQVGARLEASHRE